MNYFYYTKSTFMNLKTLARKGLATLFLSMLCIVAFAQGRKITGSVIDNTGEPVMGASPTLSVISHSMYNQTLNCRYRSSVTQARPLQLAIRQTLKLHL
jgi:hypothetical protein